MAAAVAVQATQPLVATEPLANTEIPGSELVEPCAILVGTSERGEILPLAPLGIPFA
jgi:hypothetical protein